MNGFHIFKRRELVQAADPETLRNLMTDADSYIRRRVAERIDLSRLPEMMGDPHWLVRWEVVARINSRFLSSMLLRETNHVVRETLRKRLLGAMC